MLIAQAVGVAVDVGKFPLNKFIYLDFFAVFPRK